MLNGLLKVASNDQLEMLHQGVLRVLETTGLKLHGDYLLRILAENGCDVNFDEGIVKFQSELVERQMKAQSNRYKMVRSSLWYPFCREQKEDTVSVPDEFSCDFGYAARLVYDYKARTAREPTQADQVEIIRLGNALEGVKAVCAPFTLPEFDGMVEALESARILLNHTDKPGWVGTYSAKQLKYLGELANIAAHGDTEKLKTQPPIVVTVMCTTSPLKIDNRSCEVLEAALQMGYPVSFASMPILGATTPVTPAGSAVVAAAEILGGITAASLANPETFYYSASISAEIDLKTLKLCYATPSAVLTDALLHQLFRYKYGIVHNLEPAYIDAKQPGIQAAYLKMYRQFTLAACGAVVLPMGLLDNGALFSPTQAMIDYDMNGAIYRYARGVEVNNESMALEAVSEIAFAEKQIYLEHEHTLQNFRNCIWDTKIFNRGITADDTPPVDEDAKIMENAEEAWMNLVRNSAEYELEEYKKREIDRIVQAGIRDILG